MVDYQNTYPDMAGKTVVFRRFEALPTSDSQYPLHYLHTEEKPTFLDEFQKAKPFLMMQNARVYYKTRAQMENPFATAAKQLDLAYMNHLEKTARSDYMSELEDLEKMYQEKLTEIKGQIGLVEPVALTRMATLIKLKADLNEFTLKLHNLNYKMGKSQEEDEDGE